MQNQFGKLLHQFRARKNRSIAWIAEVIKGSSSLVSFIEAGKRSPFGFEECSRLADRLEMSEDEKDQFLATAAFEHLSEKDLPFYHYFGISDFSILIKNRKNRNIPIFEYPKQQVLPPYKNILPISFLNDKLPLEKPYFGVIYNEPEELDLDFKKGDILILDPQFKTLNSGDFVLVKIGNRVIFRRYKEIGSGADAFCQFLPTVPTEEEQIFKASDIDTLYQILGKMAYSLRKYT